MSAELNALLTQRIEVAPGLVILRVVPDGWELPDFTPGQWAVLGLPGCAPRGPLSLPEDPPADPHKRILRAYSIASSSVARSYLEFYVVLLPSGALTPRLFALPLGGRLWLSPKLGGLFTLADVPADQNVALLATGTGLAPYMSMLRTALIRGGAQRFAVLHGARHSWELGYRSELMTLAMICPNFTYIPTVSRPAAEPIPWGGPAGYVQDLWARRPLDRIWGGPPTPADTHIFLCGNPAMIETMIQRLTAQGFREHTRHAPGQIHLERYW